MVGVAGALDMAAGDLGRLIAVASLDRLLRGAVTALDSRQLGRIQLAKQAKVVGDNPDSRDNTRPDNENVNRAYLDIALRRRDRPQRRNERADVASTHQECDDNPVWCLNGVQDVHAEPVKGLLQRPCPADQFHDGHLNAVHCYRVGVHLAEGRLGIGPRIDRLRPQRQEPSHNIDHGTSLLCRC